MAHHSANFLVRSQQQQLSLCGRLLLLVSVCQPCEQHIGGGEHRSDVGVSEELCRTSKQGRVATETLHVAQPRESTLSTAGLDDTHEKTQRELSFLNSSYVFFLVFSLSTAGDSVESEGRQQRTLHGFEQRVRMQHPRGSHSQTRQSSTPQRGHRSSSAQQSRQSLQTFCSHKALQKHSVSLHTASNKQSKVRPRSDPLHHTRSDKLTARKHRKQKRKEKQKENTRKIEKTREQT